MSDGDDRLVLAEGQALLLYDGVCGFCDRAIQVVMARDARDRFRFAPLQGVTAARVLEPHGISPDALNTLHLIVDVGRPTERVLSRGTGAIEVMLRMGGRWPLFGRFLSPWPRFLVDAGYWMITKVRYRLFGKYDACKLPSAEQRARFLP